MVHRKAKCTLQLQSIWLNFSFSKRRSPHTYTQSECRSVHAYVRTYASASAFLSCRVGRRQAKESCANCSHHLLHLVVRIYRGEKPSPIRLASCSEKLCHRKANTNVRTTHFAPTTPIANFSSRHLPHQHVPPVFHRLRARAAEGPRVLGHRRAHDGAVLRPKILPRDRDMRQREAGTYGSLKCPLDRVSRANR